MTKKGAKEFQEFDGAVRSNRLSVLYGINQLRKYTKRKAEKMIQEIQKEEEPDYKEKYIEALKDVAVRKIMSKYYENVAEEESKKVKILSVSFVIMTAAFLILLIKGM